jgi:hypothetical protein
MLSVAVSLLKSVIKSLLALLLQMGLLLARCRVKIHAHTQSAAKNARSGGHVISSPPKSSSRAPSSMHRVRAGAKKVFTANDGRNFVMAARVVHLLYRGAAL